MTQARIQLRRTRGWRMPAGTVKVSRPSKFGNPFSIAAAIESGYVSDRDPPEKQQRFVVDCFRDWLTNDGGRGRTWWQGPEADARREAILAALPEIKGKPLACWCKPGTPCHADVLIELANRP